MFSQLKSLLPTYQHFVCNKRKIVASFDWLKLRYEEEEGEALVADTVCLN